MKHPQWCFLIQHQISYWIQSLNVLLSKWLLKMNKTRISLGFLYLWFLENLETLACCKFHVVYFNIFVFVYLVFKRLSEALFIYSVCKPWRAELKSKRSSCRKHSNINILSSTWMEFNQFWSIDVLWIEMT